MLGELARAASAIYEGYRKADQWGCEVAPERYQAAAMQTIKLQVRVRDEAVRKSVAQLINAASTMVTSKEKPESDLATHRLTAAFGEASDRIGELLRQMDEAEGAAP